VTIEAITWGYTFLEAPRAEQEGRLYFSTTDNTDDPERGATVFRTRSDVPGLPVPPARV
jgi:hypothetical protein